MHAILSLQQALYSSSMQIHHISSWQTPDDRRSCGTKKPSLKRCKYCPAMEITQAEFQRHNNPLDTSQAKQTKPTKCDYPNIANQTVLTVWIFQCTTIHAVPARQSRQNHPMWLSKHSQPDETNPCGIPNTQQSTRYQPDKADKTNQMWLSKQNQPHGTNLAKTNWRIQSGETSLLKTLKWNGPFGNMWVRQSERRNVSLSFLVHDWTRKAHPARQSWWPEKQGPASGMVIRHA